MQTLRLKTLQTSRHSKKNNGLATIQSTNNKKNIKQYFSVSQVSCAYHNGQKITNFCKSKNCLLPLCKICVKIHTDQHERMGLFGDFQVIENCFSQIQNNHFQNLQILERMIQFSQQMQSTNDYKIFCVKRELQQAKQKILVQISSIFRQYEQALDSHLYKQGNQFCHQLTCFHEQVKSLIQQQKKHISKMYNKNLQMEFLIQSYSRNSINTIMENYERNLKQLTPQYLKLQIKQYELQRLHTVIKRYLDFGSFDAIISDKVNKNIISEKISGYNFETNKLSLINLSPKKQLSPSSRKSPSKIQLKSIYGTSSIQSPQKLKLSRQYFGNDIYKHIQKESKLNNFQSPLDNFSLQRSRHERKMKRSQNQMINLQ